MPLIRTAVASCGDGGDWHLPNGVAQDVTALLEKNSNSHISCHPAHHRHPRRARAPQGGCEAEPAGAQDTERAQTGN